MSENYVMLGVERGANQKVQRMSAPARQSKVGGFIGYPLRVLVLPPALIGDLFRRADTVL